MRAFQIRPLVPSQTLCARRSGRLRRQRRQQVSTRPGTVWSIRCSHAGCLGGPGPAEGEGMSRSPSEGKMISGDGC
jgi:hypothetical protein